MTDETEHDETQEPTRDAEAKKPPPPELFIPRVPDLAGVVVEPTNGIDPHDRWFHPI